jgi:hypothetical protein
MIHRSKAVELVMDWSVNELNIRLGFGVVQIGRPCGGGRGGMVGKPSMAGWMYGVMGVGEVMW